jgi:acyl carrier protein
MNASTFPSVDRTVILRRLKTLVRDVIPLTIDADAIHDDANLYDDCGLDSTSVIDLVLRIEEDFGIGLAEEDLEVELFQDLGHLADMVAARMPEATV